MCIRDSISIETGVRRARHPDAAHAYIDGVSKATASVRIINQSVLAAALKVSRKKLGLAGGRDPDQIARVRQDVFRPMDVERMLGAGLLRRLAQAVEEYRLVMRQHFDAEEAAAGVDGHHQVQRHAGKSGDGRQVCLLYTSPSPRD